MGQIRIDFAGSFKRLGKFKENPRFSAMNHGHLRAVREAAMWLMTTGIQEAIALDADCLAGGHTPAMGFLQKDLKVIEMLKKPPGKQLPVIEEMNRNLIEVIATLTCNTFPGWVYSLFMFSTQDSPSADQGNFVSHITTANKEDLLEALKEFIAKMEAGDYGTLGEELEPLDPDDN